MSNYPIRLRLDQPAVYQIKLLGRLGQEWSTTFGSLNLRIEQDGEGHPVTVLYGQVADQAALHGLLQEIRDLGMVLLLVQCIEGIVDL